MTGLMIAIPHTGRPIPPQWAWAFKSLHTPMNYNTNFAAIYGQPIDAARQHFAEEALKQKAKYLFFLGEDNAPPADALINLIFDMEQDPEVMIAGGIYCHKTPPCNPMVFRGNGAGCYWDWKVGEVFEVTGIGMDCTLIRTELFEKLPKPWFRTIDDISAAAEGIPSGTSWTEDLYLCNKVIKAGYKIIADSKVMCDHLDIATGEPARIPKGSIPTRRFIWPEGKLKAVDLGCGDKPIKIDGAHVIGVDIREDINPDFRSNVAVLPFATASFDIAYSSHVLEHFPKDGVDKVLDEWCRILKPNGELRLVVPNVQWAAERLAKGEHSTDIYNVLYGAQTYSENFHKFGFTPDLLVGMLKDRGFKKIECQLIDYHIATRAWKIPPAALHDKPGVPCAYQPAPTLGTKAAKGDADVKMQQLTVAKKKRAKHARR